MESHHARSVQHISDKGEIVCMQGPHVDYILWDADDESQKLIDVVLALLADLGLAPA